MAGEDGKVDHPRRSGRLKAQTRADQEHGAEDTSEVDCSRRRRLRPQSSSGQEADGEADHPCYNLRLRSHRAVSKEGKDHNRVKKPKHEFFLYIDYYREKEKANGRKLNARDASKQAKWMWKKMSDADKAPYKAEAIRLSAEYKEKKGRMNCSSPEVVSMPPLVNDTASEVIATPPAVNGTPPAVNGTPLQVIVMPPAVNDTPPAVNGTPLQEPNVSDPSWLQDLPAPPQEPVFSFSGSSMVSMYVSTGPEASSDSESLFKKGKGDGVRPSPPSVNRPAVRRGSK
ncbi:uncharacterized protein LOC125550149 isoform X2 [Triticum urartu]|uniref:uncharacterized protein LOC125550149 isoform X2 n=1 Tax=Triticum urartu TaxID=4572 RepID=UPI00204410D6|nr:uncharacterized protein LOC125550149 isoform X2 [Triticum urartu]